MALTTDRRRQAITGLIPPQLDEALIRQVWPSVAASSGIASLGQLLTKTIILAPLGWIIMALPYFLKVLPGMARRYTLTNRRVMIQRGIKPTPVDQVALSEIDDVRIREGSFNPFFRAATLEIFSKGNMALTLPGVPEPESFRQSIINACKAWVPGQSFGEVFISASEKK